MKRDYVFLLGDTKGILGQIALTAIAWKGQRWIHRLPIVEQRERGILQLGYRKTIAVRKKECDYIASQT